MLLLSVLNSRSYTARSVHVRPAVASVRTLLMHAQRGAQLLAQDDCLTRQRPLIASLITLLVRTIKIQSDKYEHC
jgi:hypothetical protein